MTAPKWERAEEGELHLEGKDPMCPIAVGAGFSDFAPLAKNRLRAGPVHCPALLLPFVSQIAKARGQTMALTWQGGSVSVAPDGTISGRLTDLLATDAEPVALAEARAHSTTGLPTPARPALNGRILDGLTAFAMQTVVPASAASRTDAGAGDDDSD